MKRLLLGTILLALVVVFPIPTTARADVGISISLPPLIVFAVTFPPETDPFSIGVLPDKGKPDKGGQRNEREAIFTGADHQDHQGIGVGSQEH